MSGHKAPRSGHHRSRRLSFKAVVWRPLNLVLLAAFLLGIMVTGWLQYGHVLQRTERPVPISLVSARAVAVKPITPPRTLTDVIESARVSPPVLSEPEQVVRAVSGAPTQLQPYEEVPTLAMLAVAPAPAVPVQPGRKPRIAIVIDDLGPDWRGSSAAIRLPAPLTLALLPYAERVGELAARARAAGHEVILHMPMEPQDIAHNDPGPTVLLAADSAQELRDKLDGSFATFDGYVGINNHMGSRFTTDLSGMQIVLSEAARRGLYFLDSRTSSQSVGQELAARAGARFVGRDVFLDNELDPVKIMAQLRLTEAVARRRGEAVAIGHPHAATIEALRSWIPQARRAGFELVPASRFARRLETAQQVSQR